jgi:hypothetical protein
VSLDPRKAASAVRQYLEALEASRPKRGRQITPESIKARLASLEEQIKSAAPMQRLKLIQQRLDLEKTAASIGEAVDLSKLEEKFVEAAKTYSEKAKITYTAWREMGIPAELLKKAGISRTRRPNQ